MSVHLLLRMKIPSRRLILAGLLLLSLPSLQAQTPARRKYSLEISTGPGPLHSRFTNPGQYFNANYRELARKGQKAENPILQPALAVSFVFHTSEYWDFAATAGLSWNTYPITQYPAFGTTPEGAPRYDLTRGEPAGWTSSNFQPALMVSWRIHWLRCENIRLYSAFGGGLVPVTFPVPLPYLSPIGFQLGRGRLYLLGEATLSPAASFALLGLGWRL